jgi:ketosteroid isomerase-like protein
MKNILTLVTVAVLLFVGSSSAQDWSKEQKEVWAGVQKYWEINNDDPQAYFQHFDDSYLGWSYDYETPGTKENALKASKYFSSKGKQQYNTITPARIWVNGDFAFVHYYYTQVSESNDGKPVTEKGRWTDILMKKGGKWMLVGDHGGEVKKSN